MSPNDYYAYIRVSTAKQGKHSVSLPEQKRSIQAFAYRQGFTISEWFEEKETAAKRGRPVFGKMLARLQSGKARGVIIHKIDRGARNLKDWADLAELIDMGVEVHTANENLDLSSRGGRLTADLQAVVAADYIRNLREETKKGLYGRLKQGLYPFSAPIGYMNNGRGKLKTIDPIKGPLVKELFELYSTGQYSLTELRKESIRIGLSFNSGKPLSKNSLSLMLNNPFYMGIMKVKTTNESFPGKHQPLISPALYKRVRAVLEGKTNRKVQKHDYLFKRMLKCAHCSFSMTGERQKGIVYYRCHTKGCKTKSVRESDIDASVAEILSPIQFSPDEYEWLHNRSNEFALDEDITNKEMLDAAQLNLRKADSRLNRLTDAFLDGDIDKGTFNLRKASLLGEKAQIEHRILELEAGVVSIAEQIRKFFELVNTAQQQYIHGFNAEKRYMLELLSSNRVVNGKNIVVELKKPFDLLAKQAVCGESCLSRDRLRTLRVFFDHVVQFFCGKDKEAQRDTS